MKQLIFIALDAEEYKKDIQKKYPGFLVKTVSLKWNNNSLHQWLEDTRKSTSGLDVSIMIGFSVGAIIALILVNEIKPKKLVLYSPSPILKEFLPLYSKTLINIMGKKRLNDFNNVSLANLSKPTVSTTIYVGSNELPIMLKTAQVISQKLKIESVVLHNKSHNNILQ